MSEPDLFVVDAFTDAAFAGNPAGVVLLDSGRPEEWMQSIAHELGFSETAFVISAGEPVRRLRWFTPVTEVDLCGHATLAAAHVLRGEQVSTPAVGGFAACRTATAGSRWTFQLTRSSRSR